MHARPHSAALLLPQCFPVMFLYVWLYPNPQEAGKLTPFYWWILVTVVFWNRANKRRFGIGKQGGGVVGVHEERASQSQGTIGPSSIGVDRHETLRAGWQEMKKPDLGPANNRGRGHPSVSFLPFCRKLAKRFRSADFSKKGNFVLGNYYSLGQNSEIWLVCYL